MANRTIAIVVTDADYSWLENEAEVRWSFVATVAGKLLAQKISELQEETDSDHEATQV